jgi:hypothetical protein
MQTLEVCLPILDPEESTWDEIIGSKDPTVFTIFLEDSAGLAGTLMDVSRNLHWTTVLWQQRLS